MARQLASFGHEVKLIAPQFVRPFIKSNKNDFVDAEAICEAANRPSMRFVTPKNEAQQTLSALHRVRELLVRDRIKTSNQIHAFLLEFGISLPTGHAAVRRLPTILAEQSLPPRRGAGLQQTPNRFEQAYSHHRQGKAACKRRGTLGALSERFRRLLRGL